jgi:hypothetical protein
MIEDLALSAGDAISLEVFKQQPEQLSVDGVVAGRSFPWSNTLGLEVDYDHSPAAFRKVVRCGARASFPQASEDLREVGELAATGRLEFEREIAEQFDARFSYQVVVL